jgi:hypothetical protein
MSNKSKLVPFIIFTLFLISCIFLYIYAIYSPYRISSEDAKTKIAKKEIDLILDVRTDLERNTLGFYPGSIHIQSSDLERIMPLKYPNKNIRIISYCNTGHRARLATEKLHKLGYKNATYISSQYTSLL